MRSGLLLHTYPPCFLLFLPHHQQWPPLNSTNTSTSSFSLNRNFSSHLLLQFHTRYRRWDSNAENSRTQNFNFNPSSNYEDDEEDDEDEDTDQLSWILDEFIDGVWIFKVFRSFGWMLPPILLSLLLATGPKAFLMALALPLGQSALSLAFQMVSQRTQNKPKRKARTKKKPRWHTANNVDLDEEEEESRGTRKGTAGYQTWVAGNDVPVDKSTKEAPRFGGWDELERRTESKMGSVRSAADGSRRTVKSKLSRRERKSDAPLLLRLLIAVFPFLGSWTKML